jgi:hypothetical protein
MSGRKSKFVKLAKKKKKKKLEKNQPITMVWVWSSKSTIIIQIKGFETHSSLSKSKTYFHM